MKRGRMSTSAPSTTTVATRKRLQMSAHGTIIVSYRRPDGCYATLVGHGSTLRAKVEDADAQLPAGEWVRECCSTPNTIYNDLTNPFVDGISDPRQVGAGRVGMGAFEGKTVTV